MATFIVDDRRISVMRKRLGKASKIIKNDSYLPMFRNRQIRFQEEFDHSVEIACKKGDPAAYLATIWSRKNLDKSVMWLRKMINVLKGKLAEIRNTFKNTTIGRGLTNKDGLKKLYKLKIQHNLIS